MSPRVVTPPRAAGGAEIVVNVADFAVARERGRLTTAGLGSCVAVALYDPMVRIAALVHVLLPSVSAGRGPIRPAKFAETAVPFLLDEMRHAGAAGPYLAKLAGGARMFAALLAPAAGGGVNMGERNVAAARRALEATGVRLVAEDVGGEHGRNVAVDVATFTVTVTSLERGTRVL
jgi:chemotaxis protein CheD